MTTKEFLELLEPGDWRLDADGNLMDGNDYCPLWSVYHGHHGDDCDDGEEAEDFVEAGVRCGLRTRDAIAIAEASDKRGHPRLRKRLLVAVGLDEPNG